MGPDEYPEKYPSSSAGDIGGSKSRHTSASGTSIGLLGAVTGEEFEGGGLRFREYSQRGYLVPTGSAMRS